MYCTSVNFCLLISRDSPSASWLVGYWVSLFQGLRYSGFPRGNHHWRAPEASPAKTRWKVGHFNVPLQYVVVGSSWLPFHVLVVVLLVPLHSLHSLLACTVV